MNKVMLIGNVGAEPQVKYFEQGSCVAQIRLATTERGYTLQNGTQVPDRTEWHTCIFWRKQAEIIEKYVHKGDKLYVEGKIQSRDWVDRQGVSRRVTEIMCDNFELLSPKPAQQGAEGLTAEVQTTPAPVQPSANAEQSAPSETDKYPF